ncbi:hypothetical protein [Streptomyces sp. NBC_01429]|uniref:hypothetical protein n=1 Tax=Streptomyces sp. NBC_01429 TaxID=2903862 RepID=UPI003FCE74F4
MRPPSAPTNGYTNPQGLPLNNLVAAGAVRYVVPVLLLFLVMRRGFVRGVSSSGLK